jgi:glycosyltransferase involved in cell wall biosynthesis
MDKGFFGFLELVLYHFLDQMFMNNLPKVTIGIPVYEVEKYIVRCLESVFRQEYPNIDILIMYDSSDDNSLELTKKTLLKSNRPYHIIYNDGEKSSIGVARNLILENFKGQYLYFLDSDDFLEAECISYLISLSQKYNADIVKSSHRDIDECGSTLSLKRYPGESVFKTDEFKKLVYTKNLYHPIYSWNKLYKRSFLVDNHMHYRHDFHEDAFFTFNELENAKKIIVTPKVTYNYLVRSNSLTTSDTSFEKISVFIDNKKFIEKFFNTNDHLYAYCCQVDVFVMTYIMIVRDAYASDNISKINKIMLLKKAFETPKLPLKMLYLIFISKKWKLVLLLLVKILPFFANMNMVQLYNMLKGGKRK